MVTEPKLEKMIFLLSRLPFDWITVQMCLKGINPGAVITVAENRQRQGLWEVDRGRVQEILATIGRFKRAGCASHTPPLVFVCVRMRTCSLMHGRGHVLETLP